MMRQHGEIKKKKKSVCCVFSMDCVSLLPRHGTQMVSPGVKEAPLPLSTRVVQLVTGEHQLCQSLQAGTRVAWQCQ